MFVYLLIALVVAAGVHIALGRERTVARAGELGLLYLLVGYCGIPILILGMGSLVHPHATADHLGLPPGSPFQTFTSVAMLGMATTAVMSFWYRGGFLIGPAMAWAIFFAGATFVHLGHYGTEGSVSPHVVIETFASHGLVSLLLVAALGMSGALKERGR